MPRIAIESSIPYLHGLAEQYAEVRYLSGSALTADALRDVDALIVRSITRCDERLLGGTGIRFIATATAGYDHIDTDYCQRRGIGWSNAPGCNALAVAQWVGAALAGLEREHGLDLSGRTLGIIGVGHVGRQVERLALACGMRVLRYDPPRAEREGSEGFVALSQLLAESDLITLHVPLTRTGRYPTYHMVDADLLARVRPGVILLNACRGAVVDTAAVVEAHRAGRLSHLLIDCWEGEPHISQSLLSLATVATPHIAGFSADGKHRGARMALAATLRHLGIAFDEAALMAPVELPMPAELSIDIGAWPEQGRVLRAMARTLDLGATDRALRREPEDFEALRHAYHYPREMRAYTIIGGTAAERAALASLGFALV